MTDQPDHHVEAIDAVAIEVARRRMFGAGYTATDATTENAAGWSITGYTAPIQLADVELTHAWEQSERVLRAWA